MPALKKKKRIVFIACPAIALALVSGVLLFGGLKEREEDKKRNEEAFTKYVTVNAPSETPFPSASATPALTPGVTPAVIPTASPTATPEPWYDLIQVDFESLKAVNPEVIGWIHFENPLSESRNLSYPIMYSGDHKYLDRTYTGEESKAGAIYLEPVNSPDLNDAHSLIYGHAMQNNTMFGLLVHFIKNDGFVYDHKYFQIITEKAAYRYEIVAARAVDTDDGIFTVFKGAGADYGLFLEESLGLGKYYPYDEGADRNHVITLSTCSFSEDRRRVISAVRVGEHIF